MKPPESFGPSLFWRSDDDPVIVRFDKGNVFFGEREHGKVSQHISVPIRPLWEFIQLLIYIGAWTPPGDADE